MLRLSCGFAGLLFALLCIARCVGQDSQAQDHPKDEGQCSPQEVADRFLEVRAQLNKPGELPVYKLGEPVVVELDIRNMSEGHLFTIPYEKLVAGELMMPAMQYVVEATRNGKPVPFTTLGRMSVERLKRGDDIEGGVVHRFAEGLDDPRARRFPHTQQPIPATIPANLLCDLTTLSDYELRVRFRVSVFSIADGEAPGLGSGTSVVKEVQSDQPLRLRIDGRVYPDFFQSLP